MSIVAHQRISICQFEDSAGFARDKLLILNHYYSSKSKRNLLQLKFKVGLQIVLVSATISLIYYFGPAHHQEKSEWGNLA